MLSSKDGKMIILSSPTGAGKTTLVKKISLEKKFKISISHTTREPRFNEIDGVDYFFTSEDKFNEMIQNDELIEWSKVYKNYYGVPKNQIDKPISENRSVLIRVDVQGAEKIKSKIPSVITIFIKPENLDQIEKHLSSRGENSKEDINTRIGAAKGEIELSKNFDYVITNQEGNIQLVIDKVKDIIVKNLEI